MLKNKHTILKLINYTFDFVQKRYKWIYITFQSTLIEYSMMINMFEIILLNLGS